jgi:hypothetical protein
VDLVSNLERALDEVTAEIGPPQVLLACDCILRRLEIEEQGLTGRVGEIMRSHHAVGLRTCGEQSRGVHVNQTLAGVAFGAKIEETARD